MTEDQATPESPPEDAAASPATLPEVLNRMARVLEGYRESNPGEIAELRRMRPGGVMPRAFWLLYLRHVPARFQGPGAEERWAVILSALAELGELFAPDAGCGRALAEVKLNERRFLQLIRAEGTTLFDLVRTLSRYLRSKRVRFALAPLARLVLFSGSGDDTQIRRDLAREFYLHFNPNE